MDEQGFDVSVPGGTIHFRKEENECFRADITFRWAQAHGVVKHPYWLTELLYSKHPEMIFFVQPNPVDFSFMILAKQYKGGNCET